MGRCIFHKSLILPTFLWSPSETHSARMRDTGVLWHPRLCNKVKQGVGPRVTQLSRIVCGQVHTRQPTFHGCRMAQIEFSWPETLISWPGSWISWQKRVNFLGFSWLAQNPKNGHFRPYFWDISWILAKFIAILEIFYDFSVILPDFWSKLGEKVLSQSNYFQIFKKTRFSGQGY